MASDMPVPLELEDISGKRDSSEADLADDESSASKRPCLQMVPDAMRSPDSRGVYHCSFCKLGVLSETENGSFCSWILMSQNGAQLRDFTFFTGIWTSYTDQHHGKHGVFLGNI